MKIALLTNGYGRVFRGAERFTKDFYDHLKDDIEIDIFGAETTDHSIGMNQKSRNEYKIPWRNGRAYLEAYQFGKKVYKTIDNDYDLIFNNSGFPCSYWCNKIRKRDGTPFITRARGGREEHISRIFKPNKMIFLTTQQRNSICKNGVVVPNAIDIDDFARVKKSGKFVGFERPIYFSAGAFIDVKRFHLVVEAFSKVKRGTLAIAGSGTLEDDLRYLCDKLIPNRYMFLGEITDRDTMVSLYKSSDVFVHASEREAFGNVYLEAMASGLPVVTQYDDRRIDIVSDAGFLVNCSDIDDFADAMVSASKYNWNNSPIQQAMNYDWNVVKDQYIELFNSIIV